MIALILILSAAVLGAGYVLYGAFLDRAFDIDDRNPVPSHADFDGRDRVPTRRVILFGHHFSSIAGAGPIVGPIIASLAFGWLPALLWVLIGSIFVGGVHDYAALTASVRHGARSIAQISKGYLSPLSRRLFLVFIWLALVYVLTVFLDLTAATFVGSGAVATSSGLYVLLALAFGWIVYRLGVPVGRASLVFVPLVFACVWLGQLAPLDAARVPAVLGSPAKTWCLVLLGYCFVASALPVWVLLQPRDYLSSFLLYASVLGAVAGILLGGPELRYPAFTGWHAGVGKLFPILFITVACGACSGFHSLVASGTSSKQLHRESDARSIGYGAMLVEGLVAVVAIITVAMLAQGSELAGKPPLAIYAGGMSRFLSVFGIPAETGYSFGLLALSCFILTTLDTATRLGRYVFEEFCGMTGRRGRYLGTLATLLLPGVFVLITLQGPSGQPIPAWKAIWPVFGATNQLLAGLALLVVSVWLRKTGRRAVFTLVPMVFMLVVTLWALVDLVADFGLGNLVGMISGVLVVLAILIIFKAWHSMASPARSTP